MKILKKPINNSWVFVRDYDDVSREFICKDLKEKILSTQVWFSDLDDSDADSPAKLIAKKAIGTSHFSLRYISWCCGTAKDLLFKCKNSESARWKKYVEKFLRTDKAVKGLEALFTPEFVQTSLYPSVEIFYSLLSAHKFYISRNVLPITQAYSNFLNFAGVYCEEDNKGEVVENFIKNHPQFVKYGISGDSVEDEAMVDVLNYYAKIGKIDVISCYISGNKYWESSKFDIQISKDRRGLLEIIS